MTELRISPRESTQGVKYHYSQPVTFNQSEQKAVKDHTAFIVENLIKEVKSGTSQQQRQKIKQLKSLFRKFVSILGGAAAIAPKATFAAGTGMSAGALAGTTITPQIVMHWGITLSLITVAVGVALSGSLLAVAGIYRMFRKRDVAQEWTTDIVKGLVQVLVAVPVVYTIFQLSQLLFKNLPVLSGLL